MAVKQIFTQKNTFTHWVKDPYAFLNERKHEGDWEPCHILGFKKQQTLTDTYTLYKVQFCRRKGD